MIFNSISINVWCRRHLFISKYLFFFVLTLCHSVLVVIFFATNIKVSKTHKVIFFNPKNSPLLFLRRGVGVRLNMKYFLDSRLTHAGMTSWFVIFFLLITDNCPKGMPLALIVHCFLLFQVWFFFIITKKIHGEKNANYKFYKWK